MHNSLSAINLIISVQHETRKGRKKKHINTRRRNRRMKNDIYVKKKLCYVSSLFFLAIDNLNENRSNKQLSSISLKKRNIQLNKKK